MLKKLLSKVKEQIKKISGGKPEKKTKRGGTERKSDQKPRQQSSKSGYRKDRTGSAGDQSADNETGRRRRTGRPGSRPPRKPGENTSSSGESGRPPYHKSDDPDKPSGRRRSDTDKPSRYRKSDNTDKPSRYRKSDDTDKSSRYRKSDDTDKSSRYRKSDDADKPSGYRSSDDTKNKKSEGPRGEGDRFRNSNRPRRRRPARKPDAEKPADQKTENVFQEDTDSSAEHVNWDASTYVVEPAEGKMRFHDLHLPGELLHAIADLNYQYCTPIQAEVLEKTLEGRDATGKAQTGTGKTAAFLITAITHLLKTKSEEKQDPGVPRVLIIAPTRELVIQIERDARNLTKYTKLRTISVFGGMDYRKQRGRLSRGKVDILVATPGRLLDFMSKGGIKLNRVEMLVLDEADRMLDMGFIPDVKKIVRSTPPKANRQTLFFSATINDNVARLAESWTKDSVDVAIDPENVAVDTVEQKVFIVSSDEKYNLLHKILEEGKLQRVIIFANRRDETKVLEESLRKDGISCQLLSGDVDQRQRLKTLDQFKDGTFRVLVATDVASRGLHIEGVSHVINYTLPEDPEDYVHRIGRTGRAGNTGISISFASEDDSFNIPAIEKFIGRKLNCIYPEDDVHFDNGSLGGGKASTETADKTESSDSELPGNIIEEENNDKEKE